MLTTHCIPTGDSLSTTPARPCLHCHISIMLWCHLLKSSRTLRVISTFHRYLCALWLKFCHALCLCFISVIQWQVLFRNECTGDIGCNENPNTVCMYVIISISHIKLKKLKTWNLGEKAKCCVYQGAAIWYIVGGGGVTREKNVFFYHSIETKFSPKITKLCIVFIKQIFSYKIWEANVFPNSSAPPPNIKWRLPNI